MKTAKEIQNILIDKGLHIKTNDGIVVVDPNEITKKLKIDVKVGDTSKIIEGKDVSGFIGYDKASETYYIGLSEKDGYNRQKFTLAHELGHYFLHNHQLKSDGSIVDTNDNILFRTYGPNDNIEKEANAFAAEYLMPESEVRKAWDKFPYASLIAPYFKVSELAMAYRLVNLGLTNG